MRLRHRTDHDGCVPVREHLEAIIAANDRRYAEVNIEREKALKIKEEADKVALDLAREIQTYKDEKANELREQINSERGSYVTKAELKPLADYITAQQGSTQGLAGARNNRRLDSAQVVGILGFLLAAALAAANIFH